VFGRVQVFSLAALFLAVVFMAWWVRGGHVRRGPLWLVTLLAAGLLAALSRRVGWGELAVLAVLVLVPIMVMPARRPPPHTPRDGPR